MDLTGAVWRKSSYSSANGGACVEVAAVWRKSSYSSGNGGQCVEVARDPAGVVAVRDSKDPDGPKLVIGHGEWRAFTGRVKEGRFDLA